MEAELVGRHLFYGSDEVLLLARHDLLHHRRDGILVLRENSGCSKQREDNQYAIHEEPPGTGRFLNKLWTTRCTETCAMRPKKSAGFFTKYHPIGAATKKVTTTKTTTRFQKPGIFWKNGMKSKKRRG